MKWLKTKRVRNRIIFTLLMIALFEIGTFIPLPYVEHAQAQSELGSLLNLVSGGALSRFGLFALGCSPFISASIVTQLWTIGFPSWERLSKQGKEGQVKLYRRTQIIGVILSVLQTYGIIASKTVQAQLGISITVTNIYQTVYLILLTTVGSLFVSYLASRVNEKPLLLHAFPFEINKSKTASKYSSKVPNLGEIDLNSFLTLQLIFSRASR